MVPVKFHPNLTIAEGRARYVESDYYLVYETKQQKNDDWRLSVDTLSLNIVPDSRFLCGLDTYAPKTCWTISDNLTFPCITNNAMMSLCCKFDINGIAELKIKHHPRFIVNSKEKFIKILLSNKTPSSYTRIGSNLIAGTNCESFLVEIWLENVENL